MATCQVCGKTTSMWTFDYSTGRCPECYQGKRTVNQYKKCPFCFESIRWEAVICRFCQKELPAGSKLIPAEAPRSAAPEGVSQSGSLRPSGKSGAQTLSAVCVGLALVWFFFLGGTRLRPVTPGTQFSEPPPPFPPLTHSPENT